MMKTFEFTGVEAEKAEAMRRYNIRRSFKKILQFVIVASLFYLWFPTVAISLQIAGDWFHRTVMVIITNRAFVFVVANLTVGLIFIFSGESNKESGEIKPDLYDQYTTSSSSSSAVILTTVKEKVIEEDDDSKKQIVPVLIAEVVVDQAKKGVYRRSKSETTKKKIIKPVMEYRRTESAKVVALERLSSEEFRLKVERFIMEKKRSLVQENDVVLRSRPWLVAATATSGYGSC